VRHTSFEQVLAIAERLDARQPITGRFEWTRENGDEVVIVVEPDGTTRSTIAGVEQEVLHAPSYAVGCACVLNLMNRDTIR
jgi:hypothetical protein